MPKKVIVLSSAIALSSFRGHSYNYHRAVRDSLKQVSISYKVLIPKNNPITEKDDLWETTLETPTKLVSDKPSKILRFFFYLYYSLCTTFAWIFFYKKFSKNTRVIVFYETGGNYLNEAIISFFLKILGKKPYAVWFLIRGLPYTKKFLYLLKISIFFAEFFSGKGRLILCADTDLLRDNLIKTLKKNVISLPIPHANTVHCEHKVLERIKEDGIKIWGLSCTGENKGEQYLAGLLKNADLSLAFEISVRSTFLEKYQIPVEPYINVISSELDAQKFSSLIQSCNVALLPYFGGVAEAYKLSSSGIFVDSITAGLMPLVTKDTWMEFELNRFNLNELVVDWRKYNALADLCALVSKLTCDENTMRKLDHMRQSYAAIHSPNGFLEALFQHNFLPSSDVEKCQEKYVGKS